MNMEEWTALNERLQAAKDGMLEGNTQPMADLVIFVGGKTIDGKAISMGMSVVDYNLDWTAVTGIESIELNGTVWYRTLTGMFDGSRLWAEMPSRNG